MNKFTTCFITLFFSAFAFSQKAPIKFGDVSLEALKMTSYAADSSAPAIILADYGESTINYSQSSGFSLNFERITRIKILRKEGVSWADFSIPLYHEGSDNEKIIGLKAVTYNLENGKIVESKTGKQAVFNEKLNENVNLVKVSLPNVKVGSVLEITYSIKSDFLINFQDWEFQSTIPTLLSEYRASIPTFFNYNKYMQGYISLNINEDKTTNKTITLTGFSRSEDRVVQSTAVTEKIDYIENNNRWVVNNVPAFKKEPFITTHRDYISKINFELATIKLPNRPTERILGTWDEISKRYALSNTFFGEITGNGFLKKTVDEIINGLASDEQKIAAIDSYVKKNILWDNTSQKYNETPLRKILEEKKANSTGINLLLGSMLEKAGYNVSMVLISTRDHGFIRETIPVSSQFNYSICAVELNDKKILLDATDPLLATGILPERCLNGKGLIINKNGHSWVDLASTVKSKTLASGEFKLTKEGVLEGILKMESSGYSAAANRRKFLSENEEQYVKDFISSYPWQIQKKEFLNAKISTLPFSENYSVVINDHASVAGDIIYLNPLLLLKENENPFKLEKREYPVDYGSTIEKIYILKLVLPEGFVIEEAPKNKVIAMPDDAAKYSYKIIGSAREITIITNFQINRSMFTQDEYPGLREFYSMVIAKQAEQIVLKKK